VALTQVTQNNEMQAGGVGQPGLERAMLKRACRLSVLTLLAASGAALAQAPPTMTFFVSSVGNGPSGGDYGGLAGADLRCQSLAAAAGAGHWNWRAYLSTAPITGFGGVLVHARDRIGSGPWYNFEEDEVASDVTDLHTNGIDPTLMLTEAGDTVPSNDHDILTGSNGDGTAMETFPDNPTVPGPTCFNWTSSDPNVYGWVGHADWFPGQSWNSQHAVQCDAAGLASTAGSGRIYCFATAESPLFADGFEAGP
jgi:hypothetical protein